MDGMHAVLLLTVFIVALSVGLGVGWWLSSSRARGVLHKARKKASTIITIAERECDSLREGILKDAKTKLELERVEFDSLQTALKNDQETFEADKRRLQNKNDRQRKKLNSRTRRLNNRQNLLHQATQAIDLLQIESDKANHNADHLLREAERLVSVASQNLIDLDDQKNELTTKQSRLDSLIVDRIKKLEEIAHLTQEDARQHLREELFDKAREDIALELVELRDQAQATAKEEAHKILLTTMQRLAHDEAESHSVSVVSIPSEGVKGRVIGREGRNVQAFEASTGVDLLIDDTPRGCRYQLL